MKKTKNPRRIIKAGLLASLVVALIAIFNISSDFKDFASIAYPPVPQSHFAYIEDAVAHCKVPQNRRGLIAALAWKESTFRPDAMSGAGAKGVTQVLSATALGVANEYQIGGLNSQTIFDPALNYKLGACYLRDKVLELGDGTDASWSKDLFVKGALVAYNAGPARGKSFIAGNYNGPISSLGYADRIMQAEDVYALDFAKLDQQKALQSSLNAATAQQSAFNNIRESIWKLILGQSTQ
jgi:hypothetical protein